MVSRLVRNEEAPGSTPGRSMGPLLEPAERTPSVVLARVHTLAGTGSAFMVPSRDGLVILVHLRKTSLKKVSGEE